MRKQSLIILTIIFLSLSGCNNKNATKTESGERLTLRFEDKEVSFEPSYAKFTTFKKNLIVNESAIRNKSEQIEATVHRIYLANYDLNLTDPNKQDYGRINAEGQYRVEIQIEAEKGASENAALKAGEYGQKSEPFDRVSWISISRFDNGKDSSSMLGGSKASGTVKITSLSDAEISGEVDFSDSDGSVKGKFTARKL